MGIAPKQFPEQQGSHQTGRTTFTEEAHGSHWRWTGTSKNEQESLAVGLRGQSMWLMVYRYTCGYMGNSTSLTYEPKMKQVL